MPFWLQVLGLFMSILALGVAIMTLPTAFQMWWGRPSLDVEFKTDRSTRAVALRCLITNELIATWWHRKAGVIRDAAHDVRGSFTIRKGGTNELIFPGRLPFHADLRAGVPVSSVIALQFFEKEMAQTRNHESDDESLMLPPGEYECELKLMWSQGGGITKNRTFRVAKNVDGTYWR